MTTANAAVAQLFSGFDENEAAFLLGSEDTTASAYVRDIGAIEGHHPWTWACGADLAQWGAFREGYGIPRDICWILFRSENTVVPTKTVNGHTQYDTDRSAALAQRFDY